jgi:hypothetical protein
MPVLFRYLLPEYAKTVMMCFSGLMTIYLVIDFFDKVHRFLRHDAYWLDILTYFLLKAPAISCQIAPLAFLMVTLLTFRIALPGPRNHGPSSVIAGIFFIFDPIARTIADVFLPNGTNVNHKLVKDGSCWWYRK